MMEAEIEQYVDAALQMHGIQLDAASRSEVLNQFSLLRSMYLIVEKETLTADIESASVFRL